MPATPKATLVGIALRECLAAIQTANGYITNLQRVYGPTEKVADTAPKPYALVRPGADVRTSTGGFQATRERLFEIEVVFSKADAGEAELDAVHIDVLRALGFGQDLPDRKFPGLIESEDEAAMLFAAEGRTTHSITITIGVTYVATYN